MDCLDEDSVLAFVDGKLDDATRLGVEGHLAGCLSCADLVASSAGGNPEARSPSSLESAPAVSGGLSRGDTVGRYVILNLVGRGGMGEVYAAYDPQLDRRIALKLLHEAAGGETSVRIARQRLLREAKAIARLSHPNVVVVHDAGTISDPIHGDRVFLAMEFIEGETLSAWLAVQPRSWQAIREVFVAAGEGLAAAHEAGLVHRDFKPQNVMVGRDGLVRVMDFGLASDAGDAAASEPAQLDLPDDGVKPTSHTVGLTRTGVLLGTPLYMAPEQFLARATDARTDQFSFCVALYEALYGERPFPSDTLSVLVDAVLAGRVREPAQKARVPSFLRRMLLRGLGIDPATRFPSMRELLDVLRSDPIRRRRTTALGFGVMAVAIAAVVGGHRLATRGQRTCRGAAEKLAGIWDLGDSARRSAVHGAFLGTGRAFAQDTWTRVSALLDDYSRRWTGAYTDACEATHVRGDQSAEVLDLRMSCLEGPRGALRALTDVFSHADGAVLIEAVNGARALPPIERCGDVPALRAVIPPPADAATRARVAALETRLADVKALRDTGQWAVALPQSTALVAAARGIDYEPLLAETLETKAWLEHEMGDPAKSARTNEETIWVSLAAHRDDIAAESAGLLIGILGYALGRAAESGRWEVAADALLRRLGPGHDQIAAWFHQGKATARERSGDYQGALAEYDLTLALKRKALPANHPDIGRTLQSIASTYNDMGEGGAALAAADQAVEIYRTAYGSQSPLLWVVLDERGEALTLLGRYKEADHDLRQAVDFAGSLFGAEHPWTAYSMTDLGKALVAENKDREATSVLEKALRIRERAEPNAELLAETRFALARARWGIDRDRPGTLALAETAGDAYRKLAGHEKKAEEVELWLKARANPKIAK